MFPPAYLDVDAPSFPRGVGRPSTEIVERLLRWSLRWISFIVQRVADSRRHEAAVLLAASALALSEGLSDAAAYARALVWLRSLRAGTVADLRGQGDGGWSLADGSQLSADAEP